jgi:MFS family permease
MFSGWMSLIRNTGVLGVSFVQAVQYYVFGSVEFFLVGYLSEVVGLDIFLVGIILGSQIIALIIMRPIIGRISDKIGRTKPIIAGITASCLIVGAFPFTTQFPLLLLLAVGYGVSFAAVLSSTSPLISEMVPPALVGASLGFLATMMDVGQTLGPIISGVIFATSLRYFGLFSSLSILLIVSIFVFILAKKRT